MAGAGVGAAIAGALASTAATFVLGNLFGGDDGPSDFGGQGTGPALPSLPQPPAEPVLEAQAEADIAPETLAAAEELRQTKRRRAQRTTTQEQLLDTAQVKRPSLFGG